MGLNFQKISEFEKGTLYNLLKDAYSYDTRVEKYFHQNWKDCDDFFYENIQIADQCCFITTLNNEAIGFFSWDPRNIPDYIEIGHNCIVTKYKGLKYGKLQLKEALSRIMKMNIQKINVTTNESLIPAQKNYESAGFIKVRTRSNDTETSFLGDYIDYELKV